MSLLSVRGLSVSLDTQEGPLAILQDVSFDLAAGGSLGLVGESGCGKSMTALAVMGLLPEPARAVGEVIFDGRDLLPSAAADRCRGGGRRLAVVFRAPMPALNPVDTNRF